MATSAPRAAARNAGAASVEAPPPSRKMLYLVIALTTTLIVGAAAGWYFLVRAPAEPGAEPVAKAPPPVFMPLEVFTVNLQTDGGDQFLQVALTLQVQDQAQVEQLKLYMPEVRNRLLLLSSKRATDILTVDGKRRLADEVLTSLQHPFVPGEQPQKVSRVFFTSFVIQ